MRINAKVLIIILFLPVSVYSQTRLSSLFSSNMVLQQKSTLAVWGTDLPGTSLRILASWGEKASALTDSNGNWRTGITTPEAGGPYTLTVEGSKTILLTDVLIGEVWLCSGQSNMQIPVRGNLNQPIEGSNEDILKSENHELRVFQVKHHASMSKHDTVSGEWQLSSPSTVPDFSATAYYFGRLMQEMLDVPVGLIVSSYGGSSIEAWMDAVTLSGFENIEIPRVLPEKREQQVPSALYNGMIHPLIPYHIKGVIWYQGESNRNQPEVYKELFPSMINSWREKWKLGDFPFYFVQIAPFYYWNAGNAAFLREAQLETMQTVRNSGMVVTLDIGDCNCVHPSKKKQVGERLAYWALAKTYQMKGITFSGPVYSSMEQAGDARIRLYFDHAPNGLSSFGKELSGFQIAGNDRKFYIAQAEIILTEKFKPAVNIWSDSVDHPVAVRYAFGNCIEATLFNTAGLPASSFRTDRWTE